MWLKRALKVLIPFLVIAVGLASGGYLYATKPKARRVRPQSQAPLVEVIKAQIGSHVIVVEAMGTVIPSRKITFKSQVSGLVNEVAGEFVPGGLFKAGDLMLKLDPQDYQLAVKKQNNQVSQALADWQLEKGRQAVAQNELKLMQSISGKVVKDKFLALREPQMAQSSAALNSARLALKQAELDLKRTEIRAPFNCLVIERAVDLGSQVTLQDNLATLVGTDSYWIEASVPVDRLPWIDIPLRNGDVGSPVRVQNRVGTERAGRVIRLLGALNDDSRMARLLIQVDDPLGLKSGTPETPLLLGSYATVFIRAKTVENVIRLPRAALRDGGRLWVLEKGTLDVRPVRTVWRGKEFVYVNQGLDPGALIVVSELSAPVQGMTLRLQDKAPPTERGFKSLNTPRRDKKKES